MQPTNTLLVMLILVSSFLTPGCQLDPGPRADLVIVGGTLVHAKLIDGAEREPVENAIIIIRDGRIVAAGPQSHVPFPKGVETLDARGKWIALGTINGDGAQLFPAGPEAMQVKEGQPADLLILENDPRIEGPTHPKIFKVIQAGKVLEPENLSEQKQP